MAHQGLFHRAQKGINFRDCTPKSLVGLGGARIHIDFSGPGYQLVFDDRASLLAATQASLGISFHSLWSVRREIVDGIIVSILPSHEIDNGIALWLIFPQSNELAGKVRLFIASLLKKIGSH